jgi:aconitate hydratase
VVAYALAGTTDIDMATEPLGYGRDKKPVFLKDIWPTPEEVNQAVAASVLPEMFSQRYANAFTANETWNKIAVAGGDLYQWNPASTYIQEPPFLAELTLETTPPRPIVGARALAVLGDSVTTDHISPAGSIAKDSPAGRYLIEHGVEPRDFNSYGSRRGNDRVMVRGTFANIRIRNHLTPKIEGGWTRYLPTNEPMTIYDAAMKYREAGVPLIVLAGAEYGTGSSRDWAAKGAFMLGIRAVLASSFERIHRSNLVGMGVLPLEVPVGHTWQSLGLTGEETFDIVGLDQITPRGQVAVQASRPGAARIDFLASVRIDTPVEMDYFRNGGILQTVLRKLATSGAS